MPSLKSALTLVHIWMHIFLASGQQFFAFHCILPTTSLSMQKVSIALTLHSITSIHLIRLHNYQCFHIFYVASHHRNHNRQLCGSSPELSEICTWFFHSYILEEVEVNNVVMGLENKKQLNIYAKVGLFIYTLEQ